MKNRTVATAGVLFTIFAGSTLIAKADDEHEGLSGGNATTVTNVNGAISALNYSENGATVNGLLVGKNVLLVFYKPVCGGYASLGKVNDSVTYSGLALTYPSGFQVVHVTKYTDNTAKPAITYPPPPPQGHSPYKGIDGKLTGLNYSEWGTINGFFFTPSDKSPEVFVNIGTPSADLAALLTVNQSVTVTGTEEPAPQCAPDGTVSEVDAALLGINGKPYQVQQQGVHGFAFGRPR